MDASIAGVATGPYDLFRLNVVADGHFVGDVGASVDGRTFGGELIAQAAMAAMLAEDRGRAAHSLHAYFLRPGDASVPTEYRVATLRDGRSFATRQVSAMQHGHAILVMTISFHRPESGPEHRDLPRDVGDPDEAALAFQRWRDHRRSIGLSDPAKRFDARPIDIVPIDPEAAYGLERGPARGMSWIRCRVPSPTDALLQQALLCYASDMMLLRCSMFPHGIRPGMPGVQSASLDHAVWIHTEPDLNDWHLFETSSSWSGAARAMSHGRVFARDGTLVAEIAQESLVRRQPDPNLS